MMVDCMMVDCMDIPWRMYQCLAWVHAIDAWDYGAPSQLADLIGSGQQIPKELAGAVADIIAGRRIQKKRAMAKLKIPAAERMAIAVSAYGRIWMKRRVRDKDLSPCLKGIADLRRMEVIDLVREQEREGRAVIEDAARKLGVSVETIENLLRDFRAKVKNWPVV